MWEVNAVVTSQMCIDTNFSVGKPNLKAHILNIGGRCYHGLARVGKPTTTNKIG